MSFDKLYRKYAGSPIRPPAPNDDIELFIPELGEAPIIKDLTEEEMKNWEDFIALKKREKEQMRDYLGGEEKLEQEEGTIPAVPKKKANFTPDTLLKMCSKYHDLCYKF